MISEWSFWGCPLSDSGLAASNGLLLLMEAAHSLWWASLRSVCTGISSLPGDIGPRCDLTLPGEDKAWPREVSESLVSLPGLPSSPLALWVLTCLDKWSDLMNLLLQVGHANLFSPVCVLKCLWSSSERVNLLPQKSQLHTKGLSPVCHRRWAFKWDVFP